MTIEDGFAQTERRIENCGKGTGYKTTSCRSPEKNEPTIGRRGSSGPAVSLGLAVISAGRAKKGF